MVKKIWSKLVELYFLYNNEGTPFQIREWILEKRKDEVIDYFNFEYKKHELFFNPPMLTEGQNLKNRLFEFQSSIRPISDNCNFKYKLNRLKRRINTRVDDSKWEYYV